jgi:hypothetical protein
MIIRVVMNEFTRLSEREQRLELIKNPRLLPVDREQAQRPQDFSRNRSPLRAACDRFPLTSHPIIDLSCHQAQTRVGLSRNRVTIPG